MEKRKEKKSNHGLSESMLEDYGDYVTRCICEFQHDDGYMICCDGCGVWQHIECMQVDTKNLPENYLCEICDPRSVDRKRARQAQIKKREDLSDLDDDEDSPPGRKGIPQGTPSGVGGVKKKRKRGKSTDTKPEPIAGKTSKIKKDIPPSASIKKAKKKPVGVGKGGQTPGGGASRVSSIQSLLNAASLLDSVGGGGGAESSPSGGRSKEHHHSRSTDIWNANLSPWSDKYDIIDHNRYSEPIRTFISSHLSQLKSEAVVYSHDEYLTWDQRNQPQCSVAEVGRRRKGLVANANIPEDELVIEYMGKITVKQLVLNDIAPESKSLWRHKPCPFVYSYDKITGVDMCIDARNSGTIARFMRRSCSPNSEIRHFFVSNELHFGVYALVNIAEGEEITLPFDFKFDKCEYMMECACGQPWTMCVVARTPRRHTTSSSKSNTTSEHTSSRAPSRQQSLSVLSSAGDEDSNSSWASSSGRKRSRHHAYHGGGTGSGSGHGPLSPGGKSSHHHHSHQGHQASLEGTSESEEDTTTAAKEKEKRRKSLSREERKTEQVWKLVEKMEASLQRKQRQQLLSEGSMESDPLSSPQNTTSHLFTSYKATPTSTGGGKERKMSNNSRKPPLYPGSKMRLSSVSSTDALSPCDLSEAFSPPFTPGLATGPDAALTPSHAHPSPLISPPPTISSHKPTFVVTPDLHPKYLFADFALPYKKAFLKQWEDEQRNCSSHANPYWSVSHTYHLTEEHTRRRIRGSLKHRWLKQHREEEERERSHDVGGTMDTADNGNEHDKENLILPAPMSHKKLMLLRWEKSVLEKTSLPLSPPPSPHTSHPPTKEEQPIKRHDSPLFEELSDEEFEETRKTADTAEVEKASGPKTPPPFSTGMELEDSGDIMEQPAGKDEISDDIELNLSSVSDTSLASCSGDEGVGPRTPPTQPIAPSVINVSDISSDLDSEQHLTGCHEDAPDNQGKKMGEDEGSTLSEVGGTGIGVSANQMDSGGDTPANQPIVEETTAVGGVQEDVSKSADSAELSGILSSDVTTMEPGEDVPHPFLVEIASLQDSAPSSPTAVGTPTKTPGKRKINLSEYRNRARKPVERKAIPEKSSPPQSSSSSNTTSLLSTPSFHSQSTLSSHFLLSSPSLSYPGSLKLSSTTGSLGVSPLSSSLSGQVGVASGSGHSQFEPVSPDEDERPMIEDQVGGSVVSLQQQQQFMSMPAISSFPPTQSILGPGDRPTHAPVMLGPGPVYLQQAPPPGAVVTSQPPPLVHMVQQGGVLQGPPPPPPGGQYGMWPPASGAPVGDPAIDPRKGLIPIPGHVMAPQQHGLYPIHGGPLIQPGIMQQHAGDMGQMMGGRGEFHHHGYVGHPPPGAPVYRPRPPGPGGNYY